MRLESEFEKQCLRQLRQLPRSWWPDKVPTGAIRGLPDRMGVLNGRFVALEFKRSNKESTAKGRAALQKYTLYRIALAGGVAYFVCPENWEEIYTELRRIADVDDV